MYRIDINNRQMIKIESTSFSQTGLRERQDLQEWIISNPSCLGEELLILQKEFDGFDNTNERLDLLALDKNGNLVIIENKTDSSGKDVVWQSVKYASYCSRLTEEKIINLFSQYLQKYQSHLCHELNAREVAKNRIYEFLNYDDVDDVVINSDEISQRIILVSMDFRPEVTSAVLWLMNFGIDIRCIKSQLFKMDDIFLFDMQQILPISEIQEFLIDVAEKKKEEVKNSNSRNTVMFEFWKRFINTQIEGCENIYEHRSPSYYSWLGQGFGYSGLSIVVNIARNFIRVQVDINESNKTKTLETFDWLEEHKNSIQESVSEPILWQRNPNKIHSLITIKKQGFGYAEPNSWKECIEYMIKTSYQLKLVVKKIMDAKPC